MWAYVVIIAFLIGLAILVYLSEYKRMMRKKNKK